jgi:hypothetical protein
LNISSVASFASSQVMRAASSEQAEGPGPDRDGDSDDVGAVSPAATKAALPQGVGQVLDVSV